MIIIVTVRTAFKTSLAKVKISKFTDVTVEDGQLLVVWSLLTELTGYLAHLKSRSRGNRS